MVLVHAYQPANYAMSSDWKSSEWDSLEELREPEGIPG